MGPRGGGRGGGGGAPRAPRGGGGGGGEGGGWGGGGGGGGGGRGVGAGGGGAAAHGGGGGAGGAGAGHPGAVGAGGDGGGDGEVEFGGADFVVVAQRGVRLHHAVAQARQGDRLGVQDGDELLDAGVLGDDVADPAGGGLVESDDDLGEGLRERLGRDVSQGFDAEERRGSLAGGPAVGVAAVAVRVRDAGVDDEQQRVAGGEGERLRPGLAPAGGGEQQRALPARGGGHQVQR